MSSNEDLDISDDLEDIEDENFEDDSDFSELATVPSKELCDVVIAFRYLGVFKSRAIACMKELAERREKGDAFAFEDYITEELGKLPVLDLTISTNNFVLPFQAFTKKK